MLNSYQQRQFYIHYKRLNTKKLSAHKWKIEKFMTET